MSRLTANGRGKRGLGYVSSGVFGVDRSPAKSRTQKCVQPSIKYPIQIGNELISLGKSSGGTCCRRKQKIPGDLSPREEKVRKDVRGIEHRDHRLGKGAKNGLSALRS